MKPGENTESIRSRSSSPAGRSEKARGVASTNKLAFNKAVNHRPAVPGGSWAARSHGRRRRNRPPPSRSMGYPTASNPFAIGRLGRSAGVGPKRSEISCCGIGLLVDEQPLVVLASSSCHPFVSSFGNSLLLSSFSTLLIAKHCASPTKCSGFPAKRRLSRAFAPFLFVQSQAGQLGLG